MKLDVFTYEDLLDKNNVATREKIEAALLQKGIIGIKGVPDFEKLSRAYINAAREFSALPEDIKLKYAPLRDTGDTEGYELGAEQFKNEKGEWQTDDKKASYYAYVPDKARNKWPTETDLKTHYLNLGNLMFETTKHMLDILGFNEKMGVDHRELVGYGRMLHYHKVGDATNSNPNWCGAHLDHGMLTSLIPAYYFRDGIEIEEPEEAGLYIIPTDGTAFEKINANDKSVLLFQIGEFAQLMSNDTVKATKHVVKKAAGNIDRYTLALFTDPGYNYIVNSTSILTQDDRYQKNKATDGSVTYDAWQTASYERYRAASAGN